MGGVELVMRVRRGPTGGLGFAADSSNSIAQLAPGGQAVEDGLLEIGDIVTSVDGQSLDGRAMGGVMAPGREEYDLGVIRVSAPLTDSLARLPDTHSLHGGDGVRRPSARLLRLRVTRDSETGALGLDLSGANVLKRGSRGGSMREDDVIVGVNGELLGTCRLVDKLPRGEPSYVFTVLRALGSEDLLTEGSNDVDDPPGGGEDPPGGGEDPPGGGEDVVEDATGRGEAAVAAGVWDEGDGEGKGEGGGEGMSPEEQAHAALIEQALQGSDISPRDGEAMEIDSADSRADNSPREESQPQAGDSTAHDVADALDLVAAEAEADAQLLQRVKATIEKADLSPINDMD
jgi:hypothetical protein